jgi:hypothetical protein
MRHSRACRVNNTREKRSSTELFCFSLLDSVCVCVYVCVYVLKNALV